MKVHTTLSQITSDWGRSFINADNEFAYDGIHLWGCAYNANVVIVQTGVNFDFLMFDSANEKDRFFSENSEKYKDSVFYFLNNHIKE